MSLNSTIANAVLAGLRPFPVAITTICNGRTNGLMSLSAGSGGIVPEAPRVTISLTKYNFTHDLVKESVVFAMHLLSAEDHMLQASLAILMGLGGSSGRDGDKMAQFATKERMTGSPVLLDALSYVEGWVVGALENEENTIFLADVLAAEQLRPGARLNIGRPGRRCPPGGSKPMSATTSPRPTPRVVVGACRSRITDVRVYRLSEHADRRLGAARRAGRYGHRPSSAGSA